MANMVTNLTFAIAGLESVSNIIIRCSTASGTMDKTDSYAILYIAGRIFNMQAQCILVIL